MRYIPDNNPECNTGDKEDNMGNQPRNPAHQSRQAGKSEEVQDSIGIELSDESAFYVGLFIAFFTAGLTYLTLQEIRGATNTLPDMVHAFIMNIGKATLTAIGLSLMAVLASKASKLFKSHTHKWLVELLAKRPRY